MTRQEPQPHAKPLRPRELKELRTALARSDWEPAPGSGLVRRLVATIDALQARFGVRANLAEDTEWGHEGADVWTIYGQGRPPRIPALIFERGRWLKKGVVVTRLRDIRVAVLQPSHPAYVEAGHPERAEAENTVRRLLIAQAERAERDLKARVLG